MGSQDPAAAPAHTLTETVCSPVTPSVDDFLLRAVLSCVCDVRAGSDLTQVFFPGNNFTCNTNPGIWKLPSLPYIVLF